MLPIPMQHVLSEVIYDDMSSSQKMAHSDQDLTHLMFSNSFSKSPFYGPKRNLVSNNCNFVSGHARQLVLVSSPRFLSPGHLHDTEIDLTVKNRVEGL